MKKQKEIYSKIKKYFSNPLYLIAFLGGTYYFWMNVHLTGSTFFENLYLVMTYVGGGYALLRMGDWI